ncbi:MAG: glycosyltransferase family 2 protein [Eubacterium sp.]|nr:glycosyltransferase family 2 protein [Eubacterium sp.]
MNELISVIVPVYKVEKYLDRCVESIVNQTYTNLEIILVDDGSPDNCPQKCDTWAQKDSRIKVLHIENNGVANARNTALEIAKGDYLTFVDSDDWVELDFIEILYTNLIDFNADISICDFQINNEDNVGDNDAHIFEKKEAIKAVAIGGYKAGVLWNKLYKRNIVSGLKMPDFACSEDLAFNYFAFEKAKKFVESNAKLYHYFQNSEGTVRSNRFGKGAFDAIKARKIILNGLENTEYKDYAVYGLISAAFVVISGCIQYDAFPKERDELINTIKEYKHEILTSKLYTKLDKFKTLLLCLSKKMYISFIKIRHGK